MISLPARPEGLQHFCLIQASPVTYPSHHDIASSDRSQRASARTTRKAISYHFLDAFLSEDLYLAESMLMVLSLLGVLGTLVSDLMLMWLDPRIRMEEGGSR